MTNNITITEDIEYRRKFARSEKDVLKQIEKIPLGKESDTVKQRFLVEIRNRMDKAEGELSECKKIEKSISDCYLNYGSKMSDLKNIIQSTREFGRLKSFYLPCVPELVDEETQRYINEINNISKERTSYGLRDEMADKKSILLSWSDYSKAWYPYSKIQETKAGKKEDSYLVKKGNKVKLDANQILVPITNTQPNNKDIDRLGHAASCANPLPLYGLSFEAVHIRKETPLLHGLITWMERQTARLKEKEEREKYA